jgi:plasmid stabilization system protein ParE
MSRLIWSPSALRDVQRLYRFLAGKNSDAAKRSVQAVRQGVKVLGQQPQMGDPIHFGPHIAPRCRSNISKRTPVQHSSVLTSSQASCVTDKT